MLLRRRVTSLLLVLALGTGMAVQAHASEIDETQKQAEELEKKKKDAENEKNSLEKQLNEIVAEMDRTKEKIDTKEAEISEKEDELIQAKVDENDQYESMKKRIKYMYENGNSQFIEILCESKSIGEFLNNAEYISTISEYDRNMLVQFQEIVKQVQEQEATLKKEYEELEVMQNELIAKQDNLNELMESKQEEIEQISDDLGATQEKLQKLKEAAEAAKEEAGQGAKTEETKTEGGQETADMDIEPKAEVAYDDFAKMQFQVGEIIACEAVPKSKKLLCSQVRIGSQVKQIVSGIKAHYAPEEMVGKKVMVLVNLKPAKLAGVLSEGMLLCAEDEEGQLALMTPEKAMPAGAEIC